MLLRCKNGYNGLINGNFYDILIKYEFNYGIVSFPSGGKIPMSIEKGYGAYYLYDYFYKPNEERFLKINKLKEIINGCK